MQLRGISSTCKVRLPVVLGSRKALWSDLLVPIGMEAAASYHVRISQLEDYHANLAEIDTDNLAKTCGFLHG